jgi:hypothetical protein
MAGGVSQQEPRIVMPRTLRAALMAAVLMAASQPAAAQSTPWDDRVFAGVSFGIEGGSADISDSRSLPVYGESATLVSNASFNSDAIIDVFVGARVWKNVGVAIGYHAQSTTGSGDIQGSIPHPIFFDRPRTFTDPIDGIDRDEYATHLQLGWMAPLGDNLDVFVYLGPSFFRLKQEVISDIAFAEQGPPFTSVVVQPTIAVRKENAVGFNIGADATYMFYTRDRLRLGVGGFLRYTGATADIALGNSSISTDLGGIQFAVGARVRF